MLRFVSPHVLTTSLYMVLHNGFGMDREGVCRAIKANAVPDVWIK